MPASRFSSPSRSLFPPRLPSRRHPVLPLSFSPSLLLIYLHGVFLEKLNAFVAPRRAGQNLADELKVSRHRGQKLSRRPDRETKRTASLLSLSLSCPVYGVLHISFPSSPRFFDLHAFCQGHCSDAFFMTAHPFSSFRHNYGDEFLCTLLSTFILLLLPLFEFPIDRLCSTVERNDTVRIV